MALKVSGRLFAPARDVINSAHRARLTAFLPDCKAEVKLFITVVLLIQSDINHKLKFKKKSII
jgi:hypothetical protein